MWQFTDRPARQARSAAGTQGHGRISSGLDTLRLAESHALRGQQLQTCRVHHISVGSSAVSPSAMAGCSVFRAK